MKTLKLIALAAAALLFSQCKTTSPTAPAAPTPSIIEVVQILDTTQKIFLQYAASTNGDPWKAIMLTTQWLKTQPNVQASEALDSIYINILMKSGLQTNFSFVLVDDTSKSLFDGGGISPSDPVITSDPPQSDKFLFDPIPSDRLNTLSTNTIVNKNVLFYCPAYSQQLTDIIFQKTLNYFTNSGLGFTVTVMKDTQCSYKAVETFKDYGLVILRTHGAADRFLTGSAIYIYPDINISNSAAEAIIVSQLGQDCLDKINSGKLRVAQSVGINIKIPLWYKNVTIGRSIQIWCTTDYIESLHSMPGTVLFGCMCYSGQSSPLSFGKIPMKTAWMDKVPISYYGWARADGTSAPVHTTFDNWMMDTLCRALAVNFDSTGHAYLDQNRNEFADYYTPTALYLKHFGADNYSYKNCIDTFTDVRDNHVYNAVCIGNQTWMAQNLNYDVPGSDCYNSDPANCATYGKLYDFPTLLQGETPSNRIPSGVQGVCPKGWHIPSDSEYQIMIKLITAGGEGAGGAMKSTSSLWVSPNVGATNSSGFSALPGGYNDLGFKRIGNFAEFYTATNDSTDIPVAPVAPITYDMGSTSNLLFRNVLTGGYDMFSCRCVKDP